MLKTPSNLKFKKYHKKSSSFLSLKEHQCFLPRHGFFAIKSLTAGKLLSGEIAACRQNLIRNVVIAHKGWLEMFLFLTASVSKKPIATRMGKGKGEHAYWMCPVRAGRILCEIAGVPWYFSHKFLQVASTKLSVKTTSVRLLY